MCTAFCSICKPDNDDDAGAPNFAACNQNNRNGTERERERKGLCWMEPRTCNARRFSAATAAAEPGHTAGPPLRWLPQARDTRRYLIKSSRFQQECNQTLLACRIQRQPCKRQVNKAIQLFLYYIPSCFISPVDNTPPSSW